MQTLLEKDQQLSEQEIITRILDGERALFELIVRRYNPYLYKIGRSYNYGHDDTEDLMQETYINVFKGLNQFEGRSSFKTWISRIMLNNCYRKTQKSSFKNELMREIDDNEQAMFNSGSHSTERIVRRNELKNIMEEVLMQIPEDYRMVFSLREVNQMNVAETANLLNISESNVKVRLSRAKEMLRNKLEASYSANELFDYHAVYCDPMTEKVMKIINEL